MIWKQVLAGAAFWALSAASLYAQLAPDITSTPKTEAKLGDAYTYDVEANGLPEPSFSLESAPASMNINAVTGVITWTPLSGGVFLVKVVASNLLGTDSQEFGISVYDELTIPVITSSPVVAATVNRNYTYDVEAIGTPTPTYSLLIGPDGMNINASTGLITWSPSSTGEVAVSVQASNEEGDDTQDFTIVVSAPSAPVITSTPSTTVAVGDAYRYDAKASGHPAPSFFLDEKPAGMQIGASTGVVTWTPTTTGTYDVAVRATNDSGSDTQEYFLVVTAKSTAPVISSSPITSGTVGQDYVYDVAATGSPAPTFSLQQAPQGMTIVASTGVISWKPATAGQFNVTVAASNSAGNDTQAFTVTVAEPISAPVITSTPVTQATTNMAYRYDVKASGNPAPVFALTNSPTGMTIEAGVIRWTPDTVGSFNVAISATNSQGADTQEFAIVVSEQPAAPTIVSSPETETFVGNQYTYDVDAAGNPAPSFSLLQSPDGMTIDASTGIVSWSPTHSGDFTITVEAENSQGSDSQEYTLTVNEQLYAPVFLSTPSTQSFLNQEYTYTARADANPTATYRLIEAPASMSINTETGEISWTPTQVGMYDISVQARNSIGSITQDFSLNVTMDLAAPTIFSFPITQALVSIEYEYHVEALGNPVPSYSLTKSPSGMTIDSESGLISWVPSAPGTFNVAVQAKNSQGSFTQSFDLIVGILGSVPLVQLKSVRLVSPSALNLTANTNPNGSPTRVTIQYGKNTVNEFQAVASPEVIEGFADVEVVARLTGLDEGTTYSYRAVAENSVGRIISSTRTFTTYQSSYQIAVDRPFSGSVDSLSYRLLGLPGDVDLDPKETLEGTQGKDWGVYADNGAPVDFFDSYDGSDRFHFKPGRGFWVLTKTNWTVPEQSVNTVALDPNGIYNIPLQSGWNIISSPYTVPVPWELVRAATVSAPATAKLWSFNGAFREASLLEPYQAYYYFNDGDEGALLSIPFPGVRSNAAKQAAKRPAPIVSGSRLVLEAVDSRSLNAAAEIMVDAGAEAGKDRLDQYAPRKGFSSLSLLIDPAFETPYGFLALDARPSIDRGEAFDLILDAPVGERIDLETRGLDAFAGVQVFLADELTGEFFDLHEQPSVSIYPKSGRTRYRLLVGSASYIDEQRVELAPEDVFLHQNYPNPFAGGTTVTYSLPEAGYVDLTVYDVLGREVQRLVSGIQPAGFYEVVWGGDSAGGAALPGGVYLLRLRLEHGASRVVSMTKVQ